MKDLDEQEVIKLYLEGWSTLKIRKYLHIHPRRISRILNAHNIVRVRKKSEKPIITCEYCGKDTTNKRFCSRGCTDKYNSEYGLNDRVKSQYYCLECNSECSYRRKYCQECTDKRFVNDTVNDLLYLNKNNKTSLYSTIWGRARTVLKNHEQSCANCGYNKHVEVCHIIPLSSFSGDTLISVVNSIDNLLLLCPNCHWEFDHHLLSLEEIRNED